VTGRAHKHLIPPKVLLRDTFVGPGVTWNDLWKNRPVKQKLKVMLFRQTKVLSQNVVVSWHCYCSECLHTGIFSNSFKEVLLGVMN